MRQLSSIHGHCHRDILTKCLRKALEDIVTLMVTNRAAIQKVADDTESLRGLYPQFKAAGSFLESIDSHESNEHCFSIISERQFEFDDVVTNSQAYRRVLVAATQTLKTNNRENTLGGGTAIDTTIASGPLEKQNNITQTANQSRKINASLPPRNGGLKSKTTASSSSATLPEDSQSQSTIIKDSNTFAQQLRGYLDHVEGEMGSAAKENAQLRQMLKEKVNEVEITEIEKDMEAERADDAENRLKVALAENAQLRTECEALLNGRAEVAAAFYTVNGAYKKLYIEAEARKNDLKTLEAENGNVKKELVQLREAHSDLDFMKQRGENTLTEAIKELEAQEAENIHLFKKLEELQGKKVLLETTQRSLLQTKNLLHDELVSTILQLEETKLEHDKLKQDASNLEDSLPKGCTIHFARINATLVPLQFPTSFDRTLSPPLFQLIYAPKKP